MCFSHTETKGKGCLTDIICSSHKNCMLSPFSGWAWTTPTLRSKSLWMFDKGDLCWNSLRLFSCNNYNLYFCLLKPYTYCWALLLTEDKKRTKCKRCILRWQIITVNHSEIKLYTSFTSVSEKKPQSCSCKSH